MKIYSHLKTPLILFAFGLFGIVCAQEKQPETPEILTNTEVVSMAQNNLGKDLIVEKIRESKGAFDVSVAALISLKQSGVSDEILEAMMEKSRARR